MRYCKNCGKRLPDNGKKEYCCWQCQRIAEHLPCPICGKRFIPKDKNQRYCSRECFWKAESKERPTYKCEYCGKEFQRLVSRNQRDAHRYCSRRCAFAWKREHKKKWASCNIHYSYCVSCGKLFTNHSAAKYCSDECRNRDKKEKARKGWHKYYDLEKIRQKRNQIEYCKRCVICKRNFRTWNNRRITCSEFCRAKYNKKANHKHDHIRRRIIRERILDNDINIQKLHKKYKGICGICGQKVDLRRKVPHPKAGTIDHILPLSKGGWHGWDNVQLACFGCNYKKRDKIPETRQTSINELLFAVN